MTYSLRGGEPIKGESATPVTAVPENATRLGKEAHEGFSRLYRVTMTIAGFCELREDSVGHLT